MSGSSGIISAAPGLKRSSRQRFDCLLCELSIGQKRGFRGHKGKRCQPSTRSYSSLPTATTAVAAGVIGGAAIVGQCGRSRVSRTTGRISAALKNQSTQKPDEYTFHDCPCNVGGRSKPQPIRAARRRGQARTVSPSPCGWSPCRRGCTTSGLEINKTGMRHRCHAVQHRLACE
jgi:hypothetical protein